MWRGVSIEACVLGRVTTERPSIWDAPHYACREAKTEVAVVILTRNEEDQN